MTTDRRDALREALANVQHYSLTIEPNDSAYMELDPDGRYVIFDEVEDAALAADPPALDAARGRWAFLDTETGDWIEVKPGVVHIARLAREE